MSSSRLPKLNHGELETACSGLVRAICSRPKVRLLCIGENHYRPNVLNEMTEPILSAAAKSGFTHLAIEYPEELATTLEQYVCGLISIRHLASSSPTTTLSLSGKRAGFPRKWFEAVKSAIGGQIRLVAVDTQLPYRDKRMAELVSAILRKDSCARVLFWAGSLHCVRRAGISSAQYRSATEWLGDSLEASQIFSIAQIGNSLALSGPAESFMSQINNCRFVEKDELPASLLGSARFRFAEGSSIADDFGTDPISYEAFDATLWCRRPKLNDWYET